MNLDGSTQVPAVATTISGGGTSRLTGNGTFGMITSNGGSVAMNLGSGALIDVQSGAKLVNGGWQPFNWTNNLAAMNLNGTFDLWNGTAVSVDAFTGSGLVTIGGAGYACSLTVGDNNGSGTFSGTITNGVGTITSLTKSGTGVQTLGGSSTVGGSVVRGGTLAIPSGGSLAATGLDVGGAANSVLAIGGTGVVNSVRNAVRVGMAQTGNTTSIGTLYLASGALNTSTDSTIGFITTGGSVGNGTLFQTGGTFSQTVSILISA